LPFGTKIPLYGWYNFPKMVYLKSLSLILVIILRIVWEEKRNSKNFIDVLYLLSERAKKLDETMIFLAFLDFPKGFNQFN
jgi:hypothetical protein